VIGTNPNPLGRALPSTLLTAVKEFLYLQAIMQSRFQTQLSSVPKSGTEFVTHVYVCSYSVMYNNV